MPFVSETRGNYYVAQVPESQTDYPFTIPSKISALTLIARAPGAYAAKEIGAGADKVTLTALVAGSGGNLISILINGVAHTYDAAKALAYAEVGNDMTVQLATSDAVAASVQGQFHAGPDVLITFTWAVKGTVGDGKTVSLDRNDADEWALLVVGDDYTIRYPNSFGALAGPTGDEIATWVNANVTQFSAVVDAGNAQHTEPNGPYTFANGSDSAVTSTTTDLKNVFATSTLVSAAGGDIGLAAALAKAYLEGGSDGVVTIKLTAGGTGLTYLPNGQKIELLTEYFGRERLSGAVLYITTPAGATCDIFGTLGNPE